MGTTRILNPVAATRTDERPLACRPVDLRDRRVALLDNQKANAGRLLDAVGRRLVECHPGMRVEVERKIATSPAPEDVMSRLRTVDAVVLAIAD